MEKYYETVGTNTYLTVQLSDQDEIDSMSLGMLTNNVIPGLAPASFTQMDMTKYIKYNVSSKVSVSQLFSGPVNKKRLVGVFSGIIDAMLSAEDYMIDPSTVILDLDHIYTDVSTCETVLICLPVVDNTRQQADLGMFFKNIIFKTQFDQTENCDHVAKIINYLNGTVKLSLEDFKTVLNEIDSVGVHSVQPVQPVALQPQVKVQPVPQPVRQPAVSVPPVPAGDAASPAQQPPGKYQNLQFGDNYPQHPHGPGEIKQKKDLPPAPQVKQEEKPMSMFYLLQHYNKENAAIYKAQQDAKKGQKGSVEKKKPEKASKAVKKTPPQKNPNVGFAVPGQKPNAGSGFAVPGVSQPQSQPVYKQPAQPQLQRVAPAPVQQPTQPSPQPVVQYQQPASGAPINFGATVVLSGNMGETTVLVGAAEQSKTDPHLIRLKNNEKIPLNKPVFRIGKEKSYVDYFISDNTAVSRSHANIINRDGEFFVVDTNSTNHTYVNGGMIHSNVETRLAHGTKLRLANEEFEFRLV